MLYFLPCSVLQFAWESYIVNKTRGQSFLTWGFILKTTLTTQRRCLHLQTGWTTPARSKIWIKLRASCTWTPWQLCVPKLAEQSFLCSSCLVGQTFAFLPQIKPAESQDGEIYFTSELQQGSCPGCCSAPSMPIHSPPHCPGDSQLGKTWHLCSLQSKLSKVIARFASYTDRFEAGIGTRTDFVEILGRE